MRYLTLNQVLGLHRHLLERYGGAAGIHDLRGTVQRENAVIGIFRQMSTQAVRVGYHHSPGRHRDYSRIQIPTIEELPDGKTIDMPPECGTSKQAQRPGQQAVQQNELGCRSVGQLDARGY